MVVRLARMVTKKVSFVVKLIREVVRRVIKMIQRVRRRVCDIRSIIFVWPTQLWVSSAAWFREYYDTQWPTQSTVPQCTQQLALKTTPWLCVCHLRQNSVWRVMNSCRTFSSIRYWLLASLPGPEEIDSRVCRIVKHITIRQPCMQDSQTHYNQTAMGKG